MGGESTFYCSRGFTGLKYGVKEKEKDVDGAKQLVAITGFSLSYVCIVRVIYHRYYERSRSTETKRLVICDGEMSEMMLAGSRVSALVQWEYR